MTTGAHSVDTDGAGGQVRYLVGDTRDMIATIPDGTVSLVATSPPFIALRSYLPADHPLKHAEIGSEPDPATFLDTLLVLTAEWGRVLAPWGSIAIELGDTYAGSGGGGGDYLPGGLREGQQQFAGSAATMRESNAAHWRQKAAARDAWPRPKCLALVPQLYAASLAYGRNLLTGQESPAGQWLVRNIIVWHRPNPAVGALGDKYRPSTSYITVATRSPKRWFDLTAVRGEPSPNSHARTAKGVAVRETTGKTAAKDGNFQTLATLHETAGAPPLDYWNDSHDTWTLTTQPSSLAHYAMWPPRLAERLVLSMCPLEVCATCGEPRRRVEGTRSWGEWRREDIAHTGSNHGGPGTHGNRCAADTTLGWTDCGHDNYTPGTVLDPFAGTGTTLAVAALHGRNAIGIDIDERNHRLYPERLDEARRALFGTKPEMPGQMSLLGET